MPSATAFTAGLSPGIRPASWGSWYSRTSGAPGNSRVIMGLVVQPHVWATGTDQIRGKVGSQRGHIEGNEPLRRTLELYRTMWQEHLLPPANYADAGATWGADFRAGQIGMLPANYAVAVLPSDKSARARTGVYL